MMKPADLVAAKTAATTAQTDYIQAVTDARTEGMTWQQIADVCGFNSRQAAKAWHVYNTQERP